MTRMARFCPEPTFPWRIRSTSVWPFWVLTIYLIVSNRSLGTEFPEKKFRQFETYNKLDQSKDFAQVANGTKAYCGKSQLEFRFLPSSVMFQQDQSGTYWNFWSIRAGNSVWLYGQLENQGLVSNLDSYIRSHFKLSGGGGSILSNRLIKQETAYLEAVGFNGELCDVFLLQIFENKRIRPETKLVSNLNPISLETNSLKLVENGKTKAELNFPLTGSIRTRIVNDSIARKSSFKPTEAAPGALLAFDYSISMKKEKIPEFFWRAWKKKNLDTAELFTRSLFLFAGMENPVRIQLDSPELIVPPFRTETDTMSALSSAIDFAQKNRIDHLIFVSKNPDVTIINIDERQLLPDFIKEKIGNLQLHFIQLEGKEVPSLKHGLKDGSYSRVPQENILDWIQREI